MNTNGKILKKRHLDLSEMPDTLTFLDRMPSACIMNDSEFRITHFNPAAERIFGFKRKEVVGRHPFETIVSPEHHLFVESVFQRLAGGESPVSGEGENITKDGRCVHLEWINHAFFSPEGRFQGIMSMANDVTARKHAEAQIRALNAALEQRVIERTQELTEANRELEAFAYTVSHDLRAPLRALEGFSRILLESASTNLDEKMNGYLRRISAASSRMASLVDDLLDFSRLGRQALRRCAVSSGNLVREVLVEFDEEIKQRGVELNIGDDLPDCHADPALLRQVFVNLISNALKFTRTRERTVLRVGFRPMAGENAWFVADNGIGFEMKHAAKIFAVFERLHGPGDYEGSGAGLAIVQRIINRHGGCVWAEAEPGRGATFFFTLGTSPAQDSAISAGL